MAEAAAGTSRADPPTTNFRRLMGRMPTGVAVITTTAPSVADLAPGVVGGSVPQRTGMTVDSLTCASYDPPMVIFFADRASQTGRGILAAERFGVSVLGRGGESTCYHFATSGTDKFAGVAVTEDASHPPRVAGTVIWLECELQTTIEAGDHTGFLGRVVAAELSEPSVSPLVYCKSRLGVLKAGSARHLPTEILGWWSE